MTGTQGTPPVVKPLTATRPGHRLYATDTAIAAIMTMR